MAQESELKLALLGRDDQEAFEQQFALLFGQSFGMPVLLKNTYFDTPEFDLNAQRVALRIRESIGENGGLQYVQTLKNKGKSQGGLHIRGEWEWSLVNDRLDVEQLRSCEAWPQNVKVEKLEKVFLTNFHRSKIVLESGESKVEFALDMGEVLSQGDSLAISEIELELIDGQAEDLFTVAKAISKQIPLIPFDISKAERGYDLFGGTEISEVALSTLINSESKKAGGLSSALMDLSHVLLTLNSLGLALYGDKSKFIESANFFAKEGSKVKAWLAHWLNGLSDLVAEDDIIKRSLIDRVLALDACSIEEWFDIVVRPEWGQLSLALSEKIWRQRSR